MLRYYVDERGGCVGVMDTAAGHPWKGINGLWPDMRGVVAYADLPRDEDARAAVLLMASVVCGAFEAAYADFATRQGGGA